MSAATSYVLNFMRNTILYYGKSLDLEKYAREVGALQGYEYLEVSK